MQPTVQPRLLAYLSLAVVLASPPHEPAYASDSLSPLTAESAISATTTGFMPFNAGVTKGGDAYVDVAIGLGQTPPGLNPGLMLRYLGRGDVNRHTRHEATDTLGYGWFLDGTSKVSWCTKGMQHHSPTLKLDGSDPLCLANRLMVLAHGEHLQPGAEYRTLLERFERVVVRGGPGLAEIWFELIRPDGFIVEYGRTADARHLVQTLDEGGPRSGAIPIAWSFNRLVDKHGDEFRAEYFEDAKSSAWELNRIVYGREQGEVRMRYAPRGDVSTVAVGNYRTTRRLRLHRIEVYLQGRKTHEYRLESDRTPTGRERLNRIQLCLFVGDGVASCLAPIVLGWFEPPVDLPSVKMVVDRVTSPAQTVQYHYGMLSREGSNDFTFGADDSPFGAFSPSPDVRQGPVGEGGFSKAVVTDYVQSRSDAPRAHIRFGYQGGFWHSTNNWGAVGFAATRQTDQVSETTTYTQYRLDFPYYGRPSAVFEYDGPYGPDAQLRKRSFVDYDTRVIEHGMARVLLPYPLSNTVFLGFDTIVQETVEEMRLSETGIETVTRLSEMGTSATPVPSDTWGATRIRLLDVIRSHRQETPGSGGL